MCSLSCCSFRCRKYFGDIEPIRGGAHQHVYKDTNLELQMFLLMRDYWPSETAVVPSVSASTHLLACKFDTAGPHLVGNAHTKGEMLFRWKVTIFLRKEKYSFLKFYIWMQNLDVLLLLFRKKCLSYIYGNKPFGFFHFLCLHFSFLCLDVSFSWSGDIFEMLIKAIDLLYIQIHMPRHKISTYYFRRYEYSEGHSQMCQKNTSYLTPVWRVLNSAKLTLGIYKMRTKIMLAQGVCSHPFITTTKHPR